MHLLVVVDVFCPSFVYYCPIETKGIIFAQYFYLIISPPTVLSEKPSQQINYILNKYIQCYKYNKYLKTAKYQNIQLSKNMILWQTQG